MKLKISDFLCMSTCGFNLGLLVDQVRPLDYVDYCILLWSVGTLAGYCVVSLLKEARV